MSTHNICFYGEIRKIIPELSPNAPPLQFLCLLWHFYPKHLDRQARLRSEVAENSVLSGSTLLATCTSVLDT